MTAPTRLDDVVVQTKPKSREQPQTRRIPPHHVILHNDPFHEFAWVVDVLRKALGYSSTHALQLTSQAHVSGQAIVWTGPKEVAELKADQIRTFHEVRAGGKNLGPLACTVEPAPGA